MAESSSSCMVRAAEYTRFSYIIAFTNATFDVENAGLASCSSHVPANYVNPPLVQCAIHFISAGSCQNSTSYTIIICTTQMHNRCPDGQPNSQLIN